MSSDERPPTEEESSSKADSSATADETKVPTNITESSTMNVTKVPNTTTTTTTTTEEDENQVPITVKSCDNNLNEDESKDVEKFGGKIVYNPDGSAYIIEDGDLSEEEALPVPKQEGCIVDQPNQERKQDGAESPTYPLIANAIYVTRSAAYYNALYGQAYAKILRDKLAVPEAPIVHSYKVYSLRQEPASSTNEEPPALSEYSTVPIKPILMCFVCKLSFGFASSFESHCTGEHDIVLTDKEKAILDAKNSSAIIQLVGKEKEAVLSFLEPVVKKVPTTTNTPAAAADKDQVLSPNAIKGLLSAALTQQQKFPSLDHQPILPSSTTAAGGPSMGPGRPALFPPLSDSKSSFLPNLPPFLANAMAAANAGQGTLLENLTNAAMLRSSIENMARKSPAMDNNNGGRSSVSPVTPSSMAPSPLSIQSLGMSNDGSGLQGTTIGACPEHINGRQTGVECVNCDMILNSPRMPGGVAWNAARNSCKTLKCPKCNWHYKYQETLEIHMKEKHPENDATCIYCITGQQHPRLARGETYTCGYKPYRCEVCNYSTTTKGNLSIHTQSDKHLNNMQELQKGGVVTSPDGTKVSKGPVVFPGSPGGLMGNPLAGLVKQKPNWRCDVCNYETNVARNLRIHMTSEKHTHNIMVLQQNVKQMQQMGGGPPGSGLFPNLPGMDPQQLLQLQLGNMGGGGGPSMAEKPGQSEAAMADMAYLQALMMQMMTGGQFPPGPMPGDFNMSPPNPNNNLMDNGLSPDSMEPPPEPAEPNPRFLFNCCVCKEFSCDSIEVMSQHLTLDRTRMREDEVSVVIAGNSICKLCNYKTNLKANFQLHCKTDKHLQRLNHVNHIKEGGPNNEWKLKFLNVANPVQLRCNACDYYTNSLHKLQLHVSNQRHEISNILFCHLKKGEINLPEERRSYQCILCKFSSSGKLALMGHVRSMKHLQMEQIHQLQKRAEGNMDQTDIGDIFQVVESNEEDYSFSPVRHASESEDAPSNEGQPSSSSRQAEEGGEKAEEREEKQATPCPLCQEPYTEYSELESHVMQIHSVNSEGLQRLLVLMEGSHWLNNNRSSNRNNVSNNNSDCGSPTTTTNHNDDNDQDEGRKSTDDAPTSTTSETPLGTISEKHVYKYRCAQCSLAFKTAEKLALHSQYHVIRDSTKCRLCSRSFRSVQALLKHVESSHNEVPSEELAHYKLGLMNHPLLMAGLSGQILDPSTNELLRKETSEIDESEDSNDVGESSASKKSSLMQQSSFMRKSDKGLTYPLEKYLDPNRPYKCDVCKESFTQKNILLVHYNSVSHLHRLKKSMQDQNKTTTDPAATTPEKSPPRITSLETALNNLANAKQFRDDDADKPYKCNICKVSYNQGSTLDIHIRSVLHQTRASKLQELALTGQIDLSKPLIEQPDSKQLQEQHKKILQEMLSPKSSFNSSSSSSSNPAMSPPTTSSPSSTPALLNLQQALLNNAKQQNLPPTSIAELLSNFSDQNQQQQLLQQFLTSLGGAAGANNESSNNGNNEDQLKSLQQSLLAEGRKSSQAVKNLLENYGFEMVMQFNEYHQRKRRDEEERLKKEAMETAAAAASNSSAAETTNQAGGDNHDQEETRSEHHNQEQASFDNEKPNNEVEADEDMKPPEIIKSKCPACSKEFSSIWVLKAHSEEVHRDVVPQDFLERYIKELKNNLDKSTSEDDHQSLSSSPIKRPPSHQASTFLTPEKSSEDERPNFPETSTPKSRSSTPAVESTDGQSTSKPISSMPKELNLSDFSSNFQKAMLSAQQQSQSINPMLLQMAQLQGMNPLVAMNLHPPLIPPSMMGNSNSNNNGQNGLPSHLMKPPTSDSSGMDAAQIQLMMKLGIDPKMLAQSGLDPKFLFQMSQMGGGMPKLPDPNFLALLSGGGNLPDNAPDPKLFFQMMQMGLPQGPDPKFLLQLAQMGKDPMCGMAGLDKGFPPLPGLPGFDGRGQPMGDPKGMMKNAVFQQPEQAKRARTRITDDQLKVLRANFDINNSPSEEQIHNMAAQTGLPPKVIKHWFRNTLFKERQKNKDSPYNFNNPPSTMLNLEEYERTGEPKVTPLNPEEQKQYTNDHNAAASTSNEAKEELEAKEDKLPMPSTSQQQELRVKNNEELLCKENSCSSTSASPTLPSPVIVSTAGMETSAATSLTLSSILSSQMGQLSSGMKPGSFLPHPLVPFSTANAMSGRLPDFLNPLANMMANEQPQRQRSPTPQSQQSSGSGGHQGKRANRTRFTDYQIKVLQEFFENNAYPKDDDLEYLSKLLSLSPRVIVVWFQNARQKARKIYENQPPIDPNDDGAGRFTRTPGLNYQCKKCLLVFQRYYELIRHQKQHCFKEEDAKRSAQAQKAAAQAAAQFSSQQVGGNMPPSSSFGMGSSHHSDDSNSSTSHDRAIQSPMFNHNFHDKRRSFDGSDDWSSDHPTTPQLSTPQFPGLSSGMRMDEEKKMTPSMFDQLTREAREHQGLFPKLTAPSTLFPSYPPSSPFGILQQQALQNQRDRDSDDFDTESVGSSPSSGTKRKHSEDGVDMDEKDESGQPRDKRLRTTILPEQLDYLYQKYQVESNPSRKMLEQIANEVGLRKRVVQVWFQNTRARERKGQFRAHQQVINKRCPFCPAIFRVRSALESHLATKHAEHYTRGEIDIDALPDAEGFHDSERPTSASTTPTPMPPLPPLVPTTSDQLHSMQKYYEDTMKRYMNDLQNNSANNAGSVPSGASPSTNDDQQHPSSALGDSNQPQGTLVGQQS